MYENAQYQIPYGGTKPVSIGVEINGVFASVPLDPANTDYAAIMALVAEGKLTIAEAE